MSAHTRTPPHPHPPTHPNPHYVLSGNTQSERDLSKHLAPDAPWDSQELEDMLAASNASEIEQAVVACIKRTITRRYWE